MKAMKVMKKKAAMKAMKAMKKKAVSKIGRGRLSKAMVLRGSKEKTVGGLKASDLTKNSYGRIVSKKQSGAAKRRFKTTLGPWFEALAKARKALKVTALLRSRRAHPCTQK